MRSTFHRRSLTLLLAGALTAGALAAAPSSKDSGPTLEPLAMLPELHGARSIAVKGDVAYVAHRGGFVTVSLADPSEPAITDRQPGLDLALPDESIEVVGDLLLVHMTDATGPCPDAGFLARCHVRFYDISEPTTPVLLGEVLHTAHNVTCIDDCRYVYTTDGAIIDATDPTTPFVADTQVDVLRGTHEITVTGPGRAVAASYAEQELLYLDTTDPRFPEVITSGASPRVDTSTSNDALRLGGSDLFVTTRSSNIFEASCAETASFTLWDARETTRWEQAQEGKPTLHPIARHTWGEGLEQVRTDVDCSLTITAHPTLGADGGLAVVTNNAFGIGLIDVSAEGEVTWLTREVPSLSGPADAVQARSPMNAVWLDEETLLSADYERGLEVLRLEG